MNSGLLTPMLTGGKNVIPHAVRDVADAAAAFSARIGPDLSLIHIFQAYFVEALHQEIAPLAVAFPHFHHGGGSVLQCFNGRFLGTAGRYSGSD